MRVCRFTPNCILEYHVHFADESHYWLSAADFNAKVAVMAPKERAKTLVIQRQLDRHLEQRVVSAPVDTANAVMGKTAATPEKDALASADPNTSKRLPTRPTLGNVFRIKGPERTASLVESQRFIPCDSSSWRVPAKVKLTRGNDWIYVLMHNQAHIYLATLTVVLCFFSRGLCALNLNTTQKHSL